MPCAGNSQLSITPASNGSIASARCLSQCRGKADCWGLFWDVCRAGKALCWQVQWSELLSQACWGDVVGEGRQPAWCGWVREHSSIVWLKPSLFCSLWRGQHATNPKSPPGSCKMDKVLLTCFLFCISAEHLCPAGGTCPCQGFSASWPRDLWAVHT